MDPMLESFIAESRENLETAGRCFLELEKTSDNPELLDDLFRAMHTIKGSSGLFDIPNFTKLVHAAEDVLDVVRSNDLTLTSAHIDLFLDTMDQVSSWLDELEVTGTLDTEVITNSVNLVRQLRGLLDDSESHETEQEESFPEDSAVVGGQETHLAEPLDWMADMPDLLRVELYRQVMDAPVDMLTIEYKPNPQCFFSGEDPLHTVRTLPGLVWFGVSPVETWSDPLELDPYQCNLTFRVVTAGIAEEVRDHLRYVSEQVEINPIAPHQLVWPMGELGDNEPFQAFLEKSDRLIAESKWDELSRHIEPLLEISGPTLLQTSVFRWMRELLRVEPVDELLVSALRETLVTGQFKWPTESTKTTAPSFPVSEPSSDSTQPSVGDTEDDQGLDEKQYKTVIQALKVQRQILSMSCAPELLRGRIASVAMVVNNLVAAIGQPTDTVEAARIAAEEQQVADPLLSLVDDWLDKLVESPGAEQEKETVVSEKKSFPNIVETSEESFGKTKNAALTQTASAGLSTLNQTLKVDQQRIDVLMDLVGELIVAKNALPFLSRRAENEYGVRALAKEIKSQYAVINRLSEELQSSIMQVRMVPVSTVFQRFPRLVRDLSRKLNKQIRLVLEGEETEADKNVVESLADPLIHLVRNSLDHGLETPQEREVAGKPVEGIIVLRAISQDDQVLIEITDDGRGIEPGVIKRKAYENGVIDEQRLDTISDNEALQLIFAAGFSTAESVSDLSGRGVGMDVVRSAVQQAGGSVVVESVAGKGATVRLSLPLSMTVTRVMMVEVAGQCYGVAMDHIVETVRLPITDIQRIKHSEAIVLRGRLIPLFSLRRLLQIDARTGEAQVQDDEEMAVLVMKLEGQEVGIVIDEFHEGLDIIQKPLEGIMGSYPYYAGAALLGDGRVLLVLNIRELLACR